MDQLPHPPIEMGLEFGKIYSVELHREGPVRGYEVFDFLREYSDEYGQGEEGVARRDAEKMIDETQQEALEKLLLTAEEESESQGIIVLANPLLKKSVTTRDLTEYPREERDFTADRYKYQGILDLKLQMIGYRRIQQREVNLKAQNI